jgi:uncharacterized protein YbjQ (UPF0145 family)
MIMTTTENLPDGFSLKEIFPLIFVTAPITLSGKSPIRLMKEFVKGGENEYETAFALLEAQAPEGANAIVGIRHSTCIGVIEKQVVMQLTLIGTPVFAAPAPAIPHEQSGPNEQDVPSTTDAAVAGGLPG